MIETEVEHQSSTLAGNISDGSLAAARKIMVAMHPAEIADALEALPPTRRRILWELIELDLEGEILMEVGDEVRENLVRDMDRDELLAANQ